jgi:hypothetical protein
MRTIIGSGKKQREISDENLFKCLPTLDLREAKNSRVQSRVFISTMSRRSGLSKSPIIDDVETKDYKVPWGHVALLRYHRRLETNDNATKDAAEHDETVVLVVQDELTRQVHTTIQQQHQSKKRAVRLLQFLLIGIMTMVVVWNDWSSSQEPPPSDHAFKKTELFVCSNSTATPDAFLHYMVKTINDSSSTSANSVPYSFCNTQVCLSKRTHVLSTGDILSLFIPFKRHDLPCLTDSIFR